MYSVLFLLGLGKPPSLVAYYNTCKQQNNLVQFAFTFLAFINSLCHRLHGRKSFSLHYSCIVCCIGCSLRLSILPLAKSNFRRPQKRKRPFNSFKKAGKKGKTIIDTLLICNTYGICACLFSNSNYCLRNINLVDSR